MKTLFTFLLFCYSSLSFAQHSDCATALTICKKDTIRIDSLRGTGLINEISTTNAPCFGNGISYQLVETNSYWIHWKVAQAGTLTFNITPDSVNDDIDFVVFRLGNDSCNQQTTVRCMATGFTPGQCSLHGSTGLRLGETDITEASGCNLTSGQNNYLAPLSMQAGESYAVCIMSDRFNGRAKMSFCGTALLGCETVPCALRLGVNDRLESDIITQFSPNPTTGFVNIETKQLLRKIVVCNYLGQFVKSISIDGKSSNSYELNMSDLPNGSYLIGCETEDGQRVFKKLVKM